MKTPCKFCGSIFEKKDKRIYCSLVCSVKNLQHDRKYKNPIKYREYLDRQNKKRRDSVRKKLGLPLDHPKVNESGKGFKRKEGYIYFLKKGHPNAAKSGYIAEHVFIMSEYLRRPLNGKETIHHKNGIRDDNRIENLEIWSHSHPFGQRVEDKLEWCKEFLDLYGYDMLERNKTIKEHCAH